MTLLRDLLFTPAEFEEIMLRMVIRTTGNTRDIAFAYHVEGKRLSAVLQEFDCTKQSAIGALSRFAKAHERLLQVRRNMQVAPGPIVAAAAASAKKPAPAPAKTAGGKSRRAA